MLVYVRPCGINEFLAPNTLDQCNPCDPGTFNLNFTATSCQACPDNTDCGRPDKDEGFLLPQDGYWHSSPYSEQVRHAR